MRIMRQGMRMGLRRMPTCMREFEKVGFVQIYIHATRLTGPTKEKGDHERGKVKKR
jgi:hypothetical protein